MAITINLDGLRKRMFKSFPVCSFVSPVCSRPFNRLWVFRFWISHSLTCTHQILPYPRSGRATKEEGKGVGRSLWKEKRKSRLEEKEKEEKKKEEKIRLKKGKAILVRKGKKAAAVMNKLTFRARNCRRLSLSVNRQHACVEGWDKVMALLGRRSGL